MSEQTPTSTDDLRGVEPSMEDILASIRKIISEDKPVAMESPEDVIPVDLVSTAAPIVTEAPLSDFGQSAADFGNSATDLASDAILDVTGTDVDLGVAEGGSVDLNIDDVLASISEESLVSTDNFKSDGLEIPEIPADATEDFSLDTFNTAPDTPDMADVGFETDDDILSFLDSETTESVQIESAPESDISELMEAVSPEAQVSLDDLKPETVVASDDVEMDSLLDDILLSPDDAAEDVTEDVMADIVEDFAEEDILDEEILDDLALDDMMEEADMLPDAEQSDLDLVKSLMAELADDPGSLEIEDDLDNALEIEGVEIADIDEPVDMALDDVELDDVDVSSDLTSDLITDTEEEDILGDILDMSLEDELQAQPDDLDLDDLDLDDISLSEMASLDDVVAAEEENIFENIETVEADSDIAEIEGDIPSLAEIASAAEADALAVETVAMPNPVAAAAGLTAAGGAGLAAYSAKAFQSDAEIEMAEAVTSVIETPIETSNQSLPTQETSMPVKAVKTDTILDEVTETATAGAFAELNQVVEDNAVFSERGPRIGDLVQEALRPMLKEWLDKNLKGIVERAVTKEVKRISKGQ